MNEDDKNLLNYLHLLGIHNQQDLKIKLWKKVDKVFDKIPQKSSLDSNETLFLVLLHMEVRDALFPDDFDLLKEANNKKNN